MNGIICATTAVIAALGLAPLASADPTAGHYITVRTQAPAMACVIGSDDTSPDTGPNVVCQGDAFPGSTIDARSGMGQHQAVFTAAGLLTYRDANIPMGGDDFDPPTLVDGRIYHLQGWTVVPAGDAITFTNDATDHGMVIDDDRDVTTF